MCVCVLVQTSTYGYEPVAQLYLQMNFIICNIILIFAYEPDIAISCSGVVFVKVVF